MTIYFIGMCVAMVIYVIVGFVVSKKVKNADDFYVAGRKAPVLLIAGSMIASYTSTGMFMGDAAQCYDGAFSSIIIFAGMQSAGYLVGAIFFGRYLRRSNALTIPDFFGKRFCSRRLQILAAVTAIIMMSVYLLSVVQGIGTLMGAVTGVDYRICIAIALVVFTVVVVTSGSNGVLITDTIMAGVFTLGVVISMLVISGSAGGWFNAVNNIVTNPATSDYLSWGGHPGVLYNTGIENVVWGFTYGIVWMSVCMVGPWQSSRYLMAKNEHAIIRSAPIAAIGVFLLEFLVGMSAVFINVLNPDLSDSSQVMIWAAINILPKFLGILLLTGVLSAGISSATTFLSLIGSSVANDIYTKKDNDKKSVRLARVSMIGVSLVILLLAIFNPPSIFWIMFLGGAVAASSWMPVAVASVFSKRVTKYGAFAGMLAGFLGCFIVKLYSALAGVALPVYLDPSIVGILCNVIAMVIASAATKVTKEEAEMRKRMFVIPQTELCPGEVKRTMKWSVASIGVGVAVAVCLLGLWVIPYLTAL